MRAFFLAKFPHINTIEDTLILSNQRGFMSHFIEGKEKPDFDFQVTSGDKKTLRRYWRICDDLSHGRNLDLYWYRAIRAYSDFTTAGRSNARLGFRRLRRLEISLFEEDFEVSYEVGIGAFDPSELSIVVRDFGAGDRELPRPTGH